MGLFDIFKKKRKKDEIKSYVKSIQNDIFPGGKEEVVRHVSELKEILGNKYSVKEIANLLLYMSTLFNIAQDKSACRIVSGAMRRSNNVFSEQDATTIYKYIVKQSVIKIFGMYNETTFNEFYKTLGNVEGGATTDVIPGAYGEYGLCPTNPVPVRGIPANEAYLRSLRLLSGEGFKWHRIGSTGAPNISDPIDMYQITTNGGTDLCVIYISPYQSIISQKAPKGFFISNE